MFKCYDCGKTFLEPETEREDNYSEFWGFPTHEVIEYDVCPYCGSDFIDEYDEEEDEEEC